MPAGQKNVPHRLAPLIHAGKQGANPLRDFGGATQNLLQNFVGEVGIGAGIKGRNIGGSSGAHTSLFRFQPPVFLPQQENHRNNKKQEGMQTAPKTILLRSSWQTVNIGDIGHTPGALRLLETYLPSAQIILWPASIGDGVREMLQKAFPRVRIVEGKVDAEGKPIEPELAKAFQQADLFVHGSGPSVLAQPQMEAWRRQTGKPYGVYGVTVGDMNDSLKDLLSHAAFVFCRDTISLQFIRQNGVTSPVMEFAPDATFAIHLQDETTALAYMNQHGLQERQFICVIPRLRYTPYHKMGNTNWSAERIKLVETTNAETRERDHAKLREVIIAWVRQTGLKVLACPEMTYEIPIAKELLVDPLPDDVKPNVVWRDRYWTPDEAASVYARAHTIVSFEMHSPIIAAANGTPAFYVRQPTDTSKGQMWRDIGLHDWIFEVDAVEGADITRTLLQVHEDYAVAHNTMNRAMDFVRQRQEETLKIVGKAAGIA